MTKTGLFFISDYRNVTCEPGRDPSYWILRELDRDNRFEVHSTANKVIDNSCFKNIDFLTLDYKGKIDIQRPLYNYRIYKAYKKVEREIEIIHHCEKFQPQKGYNLILILSNIKDKHFIIGPAEVRHKVFKEDFLAQAGGLSRFFKEFIYLNRNNMDKVFELLFNKTIERADKIIVPNETTKNEYSKYISSDKIEIINFAVDLSIYRKYKYEVDKNNYNIVYAGSALERKGVRYLLEAIPLVKKHFPEVKLHLRTDGYKVEEYMKQIKDLNISENVVFHGRLEINKYLELLSKSRLLCLPTLSDSYCYIVLDAICMGIPVVATTECKCDDLFENGKIGIKVEPKSSEQLADAILKLFNDFELCKKFSENGLKKREKFDYESTIPKYVELYERYI